MDKPCMCQLNLHLLDLTNTKPIIRKKDGLVNSLEEKVLGLTEKVDKLSSAVDRQEQYSREIAFSYMV